MRSSRIQTACFYRILEAFVFSPSQSCIFKGTDTIGQYYLLTKSCVHVTSLLFSYQVKQPLLNCHAFQFSIRNEVRGIVLTFSYCSH